MASLSIRQRNCTTKSLFLLHPSPCANLRNRVTQINRKERQAWMTQAWRRKRVSSRLQVDALLIVSSTDGLHTLTLVARQIWLEDTSTQAKSQASKSTSHVRSGPLQFFLYHTFVLFFVSARSVNVQQCLWAKTLIARTETPPTCCSNLQIRINKLKGTIVLKTEELKQLQAEGELRGLGQDIILDYFNLWIMANYSSTVQKK